MARYEKKNLENEAVLLELFNPAIHSIPLFELAQTHFEVLINTSFPTGETAEAMNEVFYAKHFHDHPWDILWAVHDKLAPSRPMPDPTSSTIRPPFAGIVTIHKLNPETGSGELGALFAPLYHGSPVTVHAVGLAMMRALDAPSQGGMGLRRLDWTCNVDNAASRRFAEKMGYAFEGVARWARLVDPASGRRGVDVEALRVRNGTKMEKLGGHTARYCATWEDWMQGGREKVVEIMQRRLRRVEAEKK